ncbi:MAG: Nif3-like dinuclear metal center hexameric protein [Halobacteriovorax sp.]|nr:Nif3-like dinuclear metal center hexameric protein [Halobacteriovorax sp.]|tara:strand:- start:55196 stop:55966 length:771 start_codon:yes stop_codon:yes gene_type:complete
MSIETSALSTYLNELLIPGEFSDYGPNGLQIEGKQEIKKIAFAVSATKDSVQKAVEKKADALIVHHGLFWKFHGTRTLTGTFAKRVIPLVRNDINLFGYHLPLDANMVVGNAATLARKLGLSLLEPFGDYKGSPTGVKGVFSKPVKALDIKSKLAEVLNHEVIHSCPENSPEISSMGIITGGANSEWVQALGQGLDAYITGEISEHDWHEASEGGIHFFAGGHHATEQFGIQALMEKIRDDHSGLEVFYIDSSNPA